MRRAQARDVRRAGEGRAAMHGPFIIQFNKCLMYKGIRGSYLGHEHGAVGVDECAEEGVEGEEGDARRVEERPLAQAVRGPAVHHHEDGRRREHAVHLGSCTSRVSSKDLAPKYMCMG